MTRLVLMSEDDYQKFITWAVADYAQEQVKAGTWQSENAMELSKKAFDTLLPDGLLTVDHYLYVIVGEANNQVGYLWFGIRKEGGSHFALLCDLVIFETYRRRGHASRALLAMEDEVRSQGVTKILLHVFGHNEKARALYRKSGYVERNVTMVKEIS
jgi:ribosomal protein S18 acetylase RimI-like enzyme